MREDGNGDFRLGAQQNTDLYVLWIPGNPLQRNVLQRKPNHKKKKRTNPHHLALFPRPVYLSWHDSNPFLLSLESLYSSEPSQFPPLIHRLLLATQRYQAKNSQSSL
ncbi:hypothetical protein AMTRI_Chr08g164990 [Amborella trichopoda]